MKMIFVVFVISRNGKHHAFADTIKVGENLASYIGRFKADVCHICESRKQAEDLAVEWNKTYKANGTNILEECL